MTKSYRGFCAVLLIGALLVGSHADTNDLANRKGKPNLKTADGKLTGRVIVKFREGVPDWYAPRLLKLLKATVAFEIPELNATVVYFRNRAQALHILNRLPCVEYVEIERDYAPNSIVTPNDPLYRPQSGDGWHLWRIGMPAAWALAQGNPNVIVAVLDTGVNFTNPDLQGVGLPGWNFADDNADTTDTYGHGTSMASIIAGRTNNGVGIASVASGVRILPVKISAPNGNSGPGVAARGLVWAADRGARVALVSYGMYNSTLVRDAARYFVSRGGVVIMPSGNAGGVSRTIPDNPYVIVVTATDSLNRRPDWASAGTFLDLSAPGTSITQVSASGGYSMGTGTCQAAAVTAGVAALVYSANRNLSPVKVESILKSTATDIEELGWDEHTGWGIVNAYRAVVRARNIQPDHILPSVSFSAPANGATVSGTVSIRVSASDNVGVASVRVLVNGEQLGSVEAGTPNFNWMTDRLENGRYTLTAIARDFEGNERSTSITVTVYNEEDDIPPTVQITAPRNGDVVSGIVQVRGTAQDNNRVHRVALYVNGRLVGTSSQSNFNIPWSTGSLPAGTYVLECRAVDPAGNVGVSNRVTVTKR